MNINEIIATLEELVVRVTILENKLSAASTANSGSKA